MDQVVYLTPDGDETPTLGRERGFLEDLFGNIGTVNAPGAPGRIEPAGVRVTRRLPVTLDWSARTPYRGA